MFLLDTFRKNKLFKIGHTLRAPLRVPFRAPLRVPFFWHLFGVRLGGPGAGSGRVRGAGRGRAGPGLQT